MKRPAGFHPGVMPFSLPIEGGGKGGGDRERDFPDRDHREVFSGQKLLLPSFLFS
jgi:hypothetical protein